MNQTELAVRLRQALEESGRTAWELSRRSNVKPQLVEALLAGVGDVPVRALIRVADSLELEVGLTVVGQSHREVDLVPTVVDLALEDLQRRDRSEMPTAVAEFLARERSSLERLETFAGSPCYLLLLSRVHELTGEAAPDWMPAWLLRLAPGHSGAPIDIVHEDGGVERVAHLLAWSIAGEGV